MKTTVLMVLICLLSFVACDVMETSAPKSSSGVTQVKTNVTTGSDGLTVEQRNIQDRLHIDNLPGSIKHLYVISAYSGQVIMYSTVKGKVTSGGKRLTPTSVAAFGGEYNSSRGIYVDIGSKTYQTTEVLQDDGSYGTSDPYIYWFDTKGNYHQHFLSGGQIVHISDQPLSVKSITINMELQNN